MAYTNETLLNLKFTILQKSNHNECPMHVCTGMNNKKHQNITILIAT